MHCHCNRSNSIKPSYLFFSILSLSYYWLRLLLFRRISSWLNSTIITLWCYGYFNFVLWIYFALLLVFVFHWFIRNLMAWLFVWRYITFIITRRRNSYYRFFAFLPFLFFHFYIIIIICIPILLLNIVCIIFRDVFWWHWFMWFIKITGWIAAILMTFMTSHADWSWIWPFISCFRRLQ